MQALGAAVDPLNGGAFYNRWRQLVLTAIDTCLDNALGCLDDYVMQHSKHVDQVLPALVKARAAFPAIPKNRSITVSGDCGRYDFAYADLAILLNSMDEGF